MHREIVLLLNKDKIWSCCLLPKGRHGRVPGHQQETLKINTQDHHSPPYVTLVKRDRWRWQPGSCGITTQIPRSLPFFLVVCSQNSPRQCRSLWGFPCTPGISSRGAPAPPKQQQIQKLRALISVLEGVTVTYSYFAGQVQGFPCE